MWNIGHYLEITATYELIRLEVDHFNLCGRAIRLTLRQIEW